MTPTDTRPLPNTADKAALKAIATRIIQTCPSLQDTAREVAGNLLKKYGITGLDPDKVYFHRFDAAQSSTKSFTGWEHAKATPTSTMTLTQLVIHRFRVTDQDNADLIDSYAGFYTAGPKAMLFNETNEVKLHGNEVLKDFWRLDFNSLYRERLTTFWSESGTDFRTLAKCNFLIQAVRARDKRQLSDEDFQFITEAVMGPVSWPVSLAFLQAHHPCSSQVRTLDVDGHVANNILRFAASKGRQIVYLPGASSAFRTLKTPIDMHYWILQQMNKEDVRHAFMTHFSLADRQQVAENITDLMNRLVSTWGKYDHHLINQNDEAISGDAFSWLSDSAKTAMFSEADLSLISNGDLRKKLWIGYLSAGLKVFGPMAVVGWPIALPVIGASIASLGLNIDQAVNGKTTEERKAGILGAVLSGIDLLFNLLVLKGPGSLEEAGPDIDAAEATEMADLKESTLPAQGSITAPGETTVETAPEPTAKVPEHFKIDVSLDEDTLVREPGKFNGTYQLTSNPSRAIKLNDDAYFVRYEAHVNGRSTWAIVDPANPDAFSGSIPVRRGPEGKWELIPRLGLRGGMDVAPVATAGTSSESVAGEWAQTPGIHVPGLEDPQMRAWSLGGADVRGLFRRVWTLGSIDVRSVLGADEDIVGARSIFMSPADELTESLSEFELAQEEPRRTLVSDAKAYYELNPPSLDQPVSTARTFETTSELLDTAFADKKGLVVGETRGSVGSKQFLIKNMRDLARRGVKTLYLQELLANVNQLDLDTFARTGEMPEELETYLKNLDIRAGNDPDGQFNLLNLVKSANAQKIRVQAIDMSTTYNINKDPMDWDGSFRIARSFFASEVIQFNEETNGVANWIALVNQENMTTFRGFQGISEQTGAVSLRIDDVAPGQANAMGSDPGLAVQYSHAPDSVAHEIWPEGIDLYEEQDFIRGDWRLQAETQWAYRSPQELEALLPEPEMFTLQRYGNNILVVYRNANNEIVESAIRSTPEGRLNLDTPLQPAYDAMTVNTLDELKAALIAKGMKPMGWLAEVPEEFESSLSNLEAPTHWQANELLEGRIPVSEPGKNLGIYLLDSNPANAIMLDDTPYYVRFEADANGGGTWAIIDPEHPNAFSGTRPVRLNAQGEWELTPRGGLKGGGNSQPGTFQNPVQNPPLPALRPASTPYDVPRRYSLRKLALGIPETHIKIIRQPNGSLRGLTTYDEHVALHRTRLSHDARQFFARDDFNDLLPDRPTLPIVSSSTTAAELIAKVFETAPGLVIGESQDRIGSMRLLIENMPRLARSGVKTIYFHRLLSDFSQLDLNTFFTTGEMSDDLEATLRQLQSDPAGRYAPLEVVKTARVNGIRVQATDCLASYRYPASPLPDMHEQAIKTYLTHSLIQADTSLNGAGKWVVLTDQENTNTFRGMAGISELQGGIGLRIEEVSPEGDLLIETDRGIEVGRGFTTQPESFIGNVDTLYADLNLQMPLPLLQRTPEELSRLLFRQGMFTFENTEASWTLIHRARNGQITRTLVEQTADGKYLVNRPTWTEVHQVPYDSIVELSWALGRMGMRLEGRLPQ
ncbi:membrane-targeted effector domain-containing toxin [Pseudomonas sp. NFX15]|uniref:membrane-targeted effector domain-containing toxin n=1 Tax=Pseudomonas sp. NFX15 TaxID=2816958 RepID=UPI003B8B01B5